MDEILASIRRILAEDASSPLPPRLRGAGDVFDLTEAIAADGSLRHIEPGTARPTPAGPLPPFPDGRVEPAVSVPPAASDAPPLVSPASAEAVAASFARLADLSTEPHAESEPRLAALVQEMLRPMLQTWLDEHLPDLVERLVREEIARVIGRGPAAP